MQIPDRLPILRMEDYHTHYLGESSDQRLFWAYETFFTEREKIVDPADWPKHRREYAVLHTFDHEGNYLDTDYLFAGTTFETGGRPLTEELESLVSKLGEVVYKNIEIRLFQTSIDGIVFGLILDEEFELINLQPSSTIAFGEPWDGEYNT